MARSSLDDPIDRFRFQVVVLDGDVLSYKDIKNGDKIKAPAVFTRAGFSTATLPSSTVNEILYRENRNNATPIKKPGLVTHNPIVFSRGVTTDNSLYNWWRLVSDDAGEIERTVSTVLAGLFITYPDVPVFRRDMIISSVNRDGTFTRHWYLWNVWPTAYSSGNGFDASSSEKLIEEITLTYESYIQVDGLDRSAANAQINEYQHNADENQVEAAIIAIAANVIGQVPGI